VLKDVFVGEILANFEANTQPLQDLGLETVRQLSFADEVHFYTKQHLGRLNILSTSSLIFLTSTLKHPLLSEDLEHLIFHPRLLERLLQIHQPVYVGVAYKRPAPSFSFP
jgi:hypothetical protein